MRGMALRGNSTSMTAPMIWVMVPSAVLDMLLSLKFGYRSRHRHGLRPTSYGVAARPRPYSGAARRQESSYCSSSTYNFRQLLGDRGLAGLVVDELQLVDQLAGVVGCGLHGHHARRHLGGDILDGRTIDLRLDVPHQQPIENVRRFRLVDVVPVLLQPFGVH